MRLRYALVAVAAGLVLFPTATAVAGDLPDVPGIGPAEAATREQGAVARPASPASVQDLPGSNALPEQTRRGAPTGRSAPTRLPETGTDVTTLLYGGLGLLGAGTALLAIRRRLATARP